MHGKRVFLYVQHLLGIGHLRRTAALAKSFAAQGAEVTLASGGFPVANLDMQDIRFVQLAPAAAADLSFKSLVDRNGRPIDEAWKSGRRDQLLDAWKKVDAHALIVELFPFGRRQMRFELIPLLEAATTSGRRPIVISSVRDVLGGGQGNPARQLEMLDLFEQYFDWLLVHGDIDLIPLSRTFVHTDKLGQKLRYTGYVREAIAGKLAPTGEAPAREGLVVSAGGGAVGEGLLEAAIRAHPLSTLSHRPCRVLCGVNAGSAQLERLEAIARAASKGEVIVERARPDFRELLERCTVSVSQAGYNTMMDIVSSGVRGVVVPFAGGGETEQSVRARAFAERGMVEMVDEANLSPRSLADAMDRAATGKPPVVRIDCDGARRSAELLGDWVAGLPA